METYQTRRSSAQGFTFPDFIFVVIVLSTVLVVGFLGVGAYHEAKKTEDAKKYGEDLSAWLAEASKERFKNDYAHGPCAGGKPPAHVSAEATPVDVPPPVAVQVLDHAEADNANASAEPTAQAEDKTAQAEPEAPPGTWGACLKYLLTETDFKALINTFSGKPPQFIPACNPADHSLAGEIFIEKMVPTPAGSAVPVVNSPLDLADPIDQKLQLRLSVCDKGAYPLKIAEFEF
jgi:hypothetical protein